MIASRPARPGRRVPTLAAAAWVAAALAGPAFAQPRAPTAPDPAHAIRVVETYDPATGARSYATVRHPSPGEIAAIQAALGRAGVPTNATGRVDRPTANALRRFQRESGLEPCGCPSYETVVALALPTRTVEVVVRSDRPAEVPAPGSATAADAIEIVYGTPPRRPAGGEAPAADVTEPSEIGGAAPAGFEAPHGVRGFGTGHHLFFPFLVAPGKLFPPPPVSRAPAETGRRGLPFGRRPAGSPRDGIGAPPGTLPVSPPRRP